MKIRASGKRLFLLFISVIIFTLGLSVSSFAADNLKYYYDDLSRLIRVENYTNGQIVEYQYDQVGNRLQKTSTVPVTITASAGSNGTITPSGTITIPGYSSQTFTITPAGTYAIQNVLVDGASVGPVGSYTFADVTANHTISASFALGEVNVGGTSYYINLQAAYDAAANGTTIKVKAKTFTENLNINRDISVTIEGGYNSNFTSITGSTYLKGAIQTYPGGGTLSIKNFVLNTQ